MNEPKAEYRRLSQTKSKIAKEKHQHITTPGGSCPILYTASSVCTYIFVGEKGIHIYWKEELKMNKKRKIYMVYTTSCLMKRKESCSSCIDERERWRRLIGIRPNTSRSPPLSNSPIFGPFCLWNGATSAVLLLLLGVCRRPVDMYRRRRAAHRAPNLTSCRFMAAASTAQLSIS